MQWSGVAVASLLAAAVLETVGLANTTWWNALVVKSNVEYVSQLTLWQRTTAKTVQAATPAGEECSTSDECVGHTWCRVGDRRCWSYSDCEWQNTLEHTDRDCSRMPRRSLHLFWAEICGAGTGTGVGEEEASGCGMVAAIRWLAFAAALLAVSAAPCAVHVRCACVVMGLACMSFACGFSAAILAMVADLPGAAVGGAGFAAHCCAMACLAAAVAAALRSRSDTPARRLERASFADAYVQADDLEDLEHMAIGPGAAPYTLLKREVRGNCIGKSVEVGKPPSSKPTVPGRQSGFFAAAAAGDGGEAEALNASLVELAVPIGNPDPEQLGLATDTDGI